MCHPTFILAHGWRSIHTAIVRAPAIVALCLTVLPWAAPSQATTVYRSVDENGVVSFSDTRPGGEAHVERLVIEVRNPELTETTQQRLEAMRETTDRMAADRMAREKHRAQLRQQRAQEQAVQAPPPQIINTGRRPVYYPFPVRRPGWNRPRPEHPIARPPMRPPGWNRPRPEHPIVRPPMRPPRPTPHSGGHDYPASLIRKGYSPAVRAAFEK